MNADIHTIYTSDFYRILDFKCKCTDCKTSAPEYADAFSISFIRRGNFIFNVFRNSFDSHTGRILVTKPGYEHTVTHIHYSAPDECTIFEFTAQFYAHLLNHYQAGSLNFLDNQDLHSRLLKATIETEYLHHTALHHGVKNRVSRIELDTLVMELVHRVMEMLSQMDQPKSLKELLKKNHLYTVERAKDYLIANFAENLSLQELADHCNVSVFHFSRIFKEFTAYSPIKFLLDLRLKNADVLLRNTTQPITTICFACGFNSLEYFSAAFVQKYGIPPSAFRKKHPPNYISYPSFNYNSKIP